MSMFGKKTAPANSNQAKPKTSTPHQSASAFVKASAEFEKNRIDAAEKSAKMAWNVAKAAGGIAALAVAAVLCLTPLKTSEPFLLYVDKNTGFANIVETLHDAKKNYGEVVDRYFLAQYVRLHEGYEWESIQSTVDQTMLFSGQKVGQEIQDFMKRPAAPYKVYGKDQKIDIKINSISFLDTMAQVRYTKTILAANGGTYNTTTGEISPKPEVSNWIATIGYEYQNPPTAEQARLVNPLGFVVQSYRTDPDAAK